MATERIIHEELLKGVLHRERKRADRSNQSVVCLVVSRREGADAPSTWSAIAGALAAAKRETDLLGWFQQGHAIGVILPDIETPAPALAPVLEARFRRELVKRLDEETLGVLTLRMHVYPDLEGAVDGAEVELHPLPAPDRARSPRLAAYDAVKRGIDIAGSFSLLVMLAPLLMLVAVSMKLRSPGPIFFRQTRIGRLMKPFTMLKFRTMHVNADHAIHQEFVSNLIKAKASGHGAGAGTEAFKLADDPRVTGLGRILRKTSIDELPQLWNVLKGEMSLVGPRPPLPYEVEQYERWHCRRVLEAKPGLTGLWQVEGRSRTTFDEMVRLDLRYARTCSFWTDVKILLATPAAVIVGKGAV